MRNKTSECNEINVNSDEKAICSGRIQHALSGMSARSVWACSDSDFRLQPIKDLEHKDKTVSVGLVGKSVLIISTHSSLLCYTLVTCQLTMGLFTGYLKKAIVIPVYKSADDQFPYQTRVQRYLRLV